MNSTEIIKLSELIANIENADFRNEMQTVLLKHIKNINKTIPLFSWDHYISKSHNSMIRHRNTKEIGKIRAYACELMICDYLNHYADDVLGSNTIFIHNDDLCQFKDLIAQLSVETQVCQSGFDILCVNPETSKVKRVQVKHRNGYIHLETTRRNSQKNVNKNSSGHVSYSADEFDYLIVVKGKFNNSVDMQTDITIFPVTCLVDKSKPDILVNRINKVVESEFHAQTITLLNELCSE